MSRLVKILAGVFLLSTSAAVAQGINIAVQVLDGRNGKPLADQHVLVFTGLTSDAVKTHARHTGVTTDKDGMGTLTIYPGETQWLQVFTDVVSLASRTLTKPASASATSCRKE